MQVLGEKIAKQELSLQDKEFIRAYVQEALEKEEKQKRRRECADLFGVSYPTIAAITAWQTIRDNNSESAKVSKIATEVPPKVSEIIDLPQSLKITDKLSDSQKAEILDEMREILRDPEELPDLENHIGCIAEFHSVSAWTVELLIRQKIYGAIKLIDSARKEKSTNAILDILQKEEIRKYVSDGITPADKQKRREEMSRRYRVGIRVISAVTAWDTIRKNRGESSSDSTLKSVTVKDEPISSIADNPSDIAMKKDWRTDFIIELASDYELGNADQRESFYSDAIDLIPEFKKNDLDKILEENGLSDNVQFPAQKEKFPDEMIDKEEIEISGEGMGALINYDNAIKIEWRKKIKEFISENTDVQDRKNMKVLCLPGIECREIPIYLELGFLPENIVGVEAGIVKGRADPKVLKKFEENALRLGINFRLGKLEKVLESEETIFDIISLDFLGPVSESADQILRKINYGMDSLVITNFQGKREWKKQDTLKHLESIHDGSGRMLGGGTLFKNENYKPAKDMNLDSARLGLAVGAFVANSTTQRYPAKYGEHRKTICDIYENVVPIALNLEGDFPKNDIHTFRMILVCECEQLADSLSEIIPYKPKDSMQGAIYTFMRNITLGGNTITKHKSYSYQSRNVPMISDMLKVEGFKIEQYSIKYPLLTELTFKIFAARLTPKGFQKITFRNMKTGIGKSKKNTLMAMAGNNVILSIDVEALMLEISAFMTWYSLINVFANKRETINLPENEVEDTKNLPQKSQKTVKDVSCKSSKILSEKTGAHINYDNGIKNKWRMKLKDFIDLNTGIEDRKNMKVLCLPGKKCLEIPLYLELGFKPENIIGVEGGDSDAIEEFKSNASKFGIQTRIGRLEKVLESEETVFDIVSLDFLGPPGENTQTILGMIKRAKKTILMTNFQGRRERKGFTDNVRLSSGAKNMEVNMDKLLSQINEGSWNSYFEEMYENSDASLKDTHLFMEEITNFIMKYRMENHPERFSDILKEIYDREAIKKLGEAIGRELKLTDAGLFFAYLFEMRKSLNSISKCDITDIIVNVISRIYSNIFKSFILTGSASYKYRGNKGTPMLADFMVLEELDEQYYFETRHMRDFTLRSMRLFNKHFHEKKIKFVICNEDNQAVINPKYYKNKYKLAMLLDGVMEESITISRINKAGNLLKEVIAAHNWPNYREDILMPKEAADIV